MESLSVEYQNHSDYPLAPSTFLLVWYGVRFLKSRAHECRVPRDSTISFSVRRTVFYSIEVLKQNAGTHSTEAMPF